VAKKKQALLDGVVELKNAGPIQGIFKIDVSKGPGLYTLTGGKATGKSTVLRGLQILQGHKVEVTIHDGEMDGYVAGWGVVAPFGPRRRPSGDFELETLEGATFADFIEPQGKTAVTRDRSCIQTLIALTGVEAQPSDYYDLAGGRESFKKLGIADTDDPIVLAKRVKSKLEELAREAETEHNVEDGHVKAIEAQVAAVDLAAPSDLDALMTERDAAKGLADLLASQKKAADVREEEIRKAREKLEDERKRYTGGTVNATGNELNEAEKKLNNWHDKVEELERALRDATAMRDAQQVAVEQAGLRHDNARRHEITISAWEETISKPLPAPTAEDIQAADDALAAAKTAYDTGVVVNEAKKAQERAESHRRKANLAKATADAMRDAASQAFPILTTRLETREIIVEQIEDEARLLVKHPTRKKKVFFNEPNDLSEGQRIMVAIRELLPRVKKPGIFDVPQHVYAGIQPADRAELHKFAADNGIFLFGAIIDDGELEVHYGVEA